MRRVIALDLDGTLLRNDGTISPRTLLALRQCRQNGKRLVIATARAPHMVALALPVDLAEVPWVCYNRAEVYEGGQRVLQNAIDPTTTKEIIQTILAANPRATISVAIDDLLFSNRPFGGPWNPQVADLYEVTDRPAARIMFDMPDIGNADGLAAMLSDKCRFIVTDHGALGQVMAASASKAWALKVLLSRWKLALTDVIAFGDDANDIEMLVESGLGIAMGNACDQLKEVADRVTLSNNEDGIAEVLEAMLREPDA